MSGILGKDLYGGSLRINGFPVIDGDQNMCVNGVLKTDYIAEKTAAHGVVIQHDLCLDSGKVLKVNGTQVVGSQQAPIGDVNTSNLTEVGNGVNSILQILRNHGLIASPP